jgi:hypothetical protein
MHDHGGGMEIFRLARLSVLAGALMLAGSSLADMRKPLDGGSPLQYEPFPEAAAQHATDPCARLEKGAWHLSAVHCSEMMPVETISGVLITGFEERSFFPGESRVPDRNDPRRYKSEPEMDDLLIETLPGRPDAPYVAVLMTFRGRRTRYPFLIDCEGRRAYTYVVDRMVSARYIGTIADPDAATIRSWGRSSKPFPFSGEGGRIAEMEKAQAEKCAR